MTTKLHEDRKVNYSRGLLTLLMVTMGVLHLFLPAPFVKVMPSYLPYPLQLVLISGVCEIAGGLGLQLTLTRRWAAFGLIALYIAVFPANINMALHANQFGPAWLFWLRLPLQILLIWWAYANRQ